MASTSTPESGLIREIERLRHERRAKREPILLSTVVALFTAGLGAILLIIEWQNLRLGLTELFPPTSDNSGVSISGAVSIASMVLILIGDILLDKASEHWSERAHRRVESIGIILLVLFLLASMVLMPSSIYQANDVMDGTNGGGASTWAYLGFGCMMALWIPTALLGNYTLFQYLKPALQRIDRTRQHDAWQRDVKAKLDEYVALSGQLREVEQQRDNIPSDAEVTQHCAAEMSATIGEVESELSGVILRRKAAEASTTIDAPLAATDNAYLNAVPVEALLTHRDHLAGFTPETIEQILNRKGN